MILIGIDKYPVENCKVCKYELGLTKVNLEIIREEMFALTVRCGQCDLMFYYNYVYDNQVKCKCWHSYHEKRCFCGCERFDLNVESLEGCLTITEPSFSSFTLCR